MVQYGEERHWDETSDEEESEEGSDDEDEDVEESDEDEDGTEEEDDEDDDDGNGDDDDDKDIEGDGKKFQDEPNATRNGSNNIVEDYGVEDVPGDEDLEKGEKSNRFGGGENSKKKTAGILCCCVVILAIIGGTVGGVLSKDDDDESSTPRATTVPLPAPTTAPVPATTAAPAPPPTPLPTTAAPTAPLPAEFSILAAADTFVYLEGGEEGPFGDTEALLIEKDVGVESLALVSFDVTALLSREGLDELSPKAFLYLSVFGGGNSTLAGDIILDTLLFPSYPGDVETLTSSISTSVANVSRVMGPSFNISSGNTEVLVDISSLIFENSSSMVLRRLQETEKQEILIGLMISETESETGSIEFYSSESDFPPRLDIQVDVGSSGCLICGAGNITNPDAELVLPQIGNTTCADLQMVADTGVVSDSQCELLQPVVEAICCGDMEDLYVCDLCLDGGAVTNLNATISMMGQEGTTCEQLLAVAQIGGIPEMECGQLRNITDDVCCGIEL